MTIVTINRDPFARADFIRRRVVGRGYVCRWCGQAARFQYGWWRDDRTDPEWMPGLFCGVSCYRDYHDERAP